ncbi:MAG TPA: hypothetical protein PL002_11555 [Flavobacteriales bacterium]|nr:hypothetical protein [Flavobacteriales bacterium]
MRTTTLIWLCAWNLSAMAQSWFPNGATWTYDYANFIITGYVAHEVSGDTLIDGRLCKVIERTRVSSSGSNVDTLERTPFCVLDSAGVVWIHVPSEGLDTLYVMDAVPGDQWMLAAVPEDCDSTAYLEVVDTGHVVLDGLPLRWLAVDLHPDPTHLPWVYQDTIVERLGSLRYYLAPQDPCLGGFDAAEGGPLRCYADAQVSFMSSSVSTCELNLGVDDHSAGSHFQLFPDPGGDGFEVRSSQPIQAVAVRDAAGRMFLTKPGGSLVHVPAVQWPAGCYLVAAEFGNGTRAVRKWIKP